MDTEPLTDQLPLLTAEPNPPQVSARCSNLCGTIGLTKHMVYNSDHDRYFCSIVCYNEFLTAWKYGWDVEDFS